MNQFAEITINYKPVVSFTDLPSVCRSSETVEQLRQVWSDTISYREEFLIMLLNRANKVLGFSKIGVGGLSGVVVDPKVIFQTALKANAASIILAHNHPSGNTRPSDADKSLTQKVVNAGIFLDLKVLDHIILTADNYFSFADEGLI